MDDDRTLYIGNIDKNVTDEILYELFLQAGPIERVNIVNGRNDSSSYGFVTYKHECSIDYAIELFKGTNLFKKELSIKKRSPKNSYSQQTNEFSKFGISMDSNQTSCRQGILDFQDQLHSLQLLAQNLRNPLPLLNSGSNSLRGNSSSHNRPYDCGMKNHFSRPREIRDRWKDRDYGNKMYHGRKNRHRD